MDVAKGQNWLVSTLCTCYFTWVSQPCGLMLATFGEYLWIVSSYDGCIKMFL